MGNKQLGPGKEQQALIALTDRQTVVHAHAVLAVVHGMTAVAVGDTAIVESESGGSRDHQGSSR